MLSLIGTKCLGSARLAAAVMTCWLAGCSGSGNHRLADAALPTQPADGPLPVDRADGAWTVDRADGMLETKPADGSVRAERADGPLALDSPGGTNSRMDARAPLSNDDGSYQDPVLRFDGLYQKSNDDGYTSYLRFLADLTVLQVTSSGTPQQVTTWLKKNAGKGSQGQYLLDGASISFVVTSTMGSVEYSGQVGDDQLVLQVHSLINDHRATNTYTFVPL